MTGVTGEHSEAGVRLADLYLARVLCGLLAVVAIETLIQLVLEIYRPRTKGRPQRPLYESRLVGLLGQPEGLITTAAQALDYQFGFKVSETWFYRFFERALGTLLLLQLGALLLSTCVVFIEAGEQGLLERFGRPVEGRTLLEAGAHFYVCGDASRMAKDVDAALHKIVETAGGKNADDAKAYVTKLKSDKRYQRDVY